MANERLSFSALLRHLVLLTVVSVVWMAEPGYYQYGNLNGFFYVWAPSGLHVYDPVAKTVIKTVTDGPKTFGDAVYIRDQAQLKHYAFLAENAPGNKMHVYDTTTHTCIAVVAIGNNPVHIYALPSKDQVWAHLDGQGDFDVFHMSAVRYRTASSAAHDATATVPGHGKLLVEPELENHAYVTNVNAGIITSVNLDSRDTLATLVVNQNKTVSPYACGGTHGIAYTSVDGQLYVECTNPYGATCDATATTAKCPGSLWQIDPAQLAAPITPTKPARTRLVSPLASDIINKATPGAGDKYGIHGQPFASPEKQFVLVPNKLLNTLTILKPQPRVCTVNAAGVQVCPPILPPQLLEVKIPDGPGSVKFWPKDSSVTFGTDPNPGNYVAVIAQEARTSSAGLAIVDMADVVAAFKALGTTQAGLFNGQVTYVPLGPGNTYRPMERGNDYIMTAVYDVASAAYTGVATYNMRTKEVTKVALPGSAKLLWVPVFTDELAQAVAQTQALQAQLTAMQQDQAAAHEARQKQWQSISTQALTVGAVALAFTLLTLLALAGYMYYHVTRLHAKYNELQAPLQGRVADVDHRV